MLNLCAEWLTRRISQKKNMIRFAYYLLFCSLLLAVDKQEKAKTKFIVSGTVVDANGNGLKKVDITILDENEKKVKSGKSKKNGEFKFKKIPSGSYTLVTRHKDEGLLETAFSILSKDLDLKIQYSNENQDPELLNNDLNAITSTTSDLLPQQREKPEDQKLRFDDLFFEYESNLKALETEIDSLKSVVKGYQKGQTMPNVSRELLDLIKIPDSQHRIELQNGTVVSGELLQESDSTLTLKTQIGTLVLKKEMVVRLDELEKPGPKVVFLGDPFIDYYPDRQVFSGRVKNIGQIRADFVRVIGNLFDQTTEITGTDSVFVKGTRIAYESNVVADTALKPGQTASYVLTVKISKGRKAQYHTMDIQWDQTN